MTRHSSVNSRTIITDNDISCDLSDVQTHDKDAFEHINSIWVEHEKVFKSFEKKFQYINVYGKMIYFDPNDIIFRLTMRADT